MRISRILAIATGLELVALAALAAIAGVFGFAHDDLDLFNNLAPIWLAVAAFGGGLCWFALGPRRARAAAMAGVVFTGLVFGLPIAWELSQRVAQGISRPAPTGAALRVVTFNASANNYSPDLTVEALLAADPDVILMQEPVQILARGQALDARYPHRALCPGGACALAIWSKRPILRSGHVAKRPGEAGWSDVEFLWAETLAPDGRPVTVATTHYLWQLQGGADMQRHLLDGYAAKLPRDAILTGDFNLTPWTYALRRQDQRLLPLKRRTRAAFSWPAYVPRLYSRIYVPLMPIDHLYAGPAWKTVSVKRLPRAPSDHYPMMVTLAR